MVNEVAGLGLLELLDTVDELLESAEFVREHGAGLHADLLDGHDAVAATNPILATGFAEGALRLAIAGQGNALRTLTMLTPEPVGDLDPDYAERLPRLLGAALDVWGLDGLSASALRATLTALRDVPDAAVAAAFECGLDQVRQAVRSAEPLVALRQARDSFAAGEAGEEDGGDAVLYGAGLDAVLAFFAGDPAGVRAARETIMDRLARQAGALRNNHVPAWRRPRADAANAWAPLVAILDRAAPAITEPVWLNAWEALDAVLDAYRLERAVVPVVGVVDPDGFPRLLRPAVENAISRRHAMLLQLYQAVAIAENAAEPPVRLTELRALRDRIEGLARGTGGPPAEPDHDVRERLRAATPSLVREVGYPAAAVLADRRSTPGLRLMERTAAASTQLVEEVEHFLQAEPGFFLAVAVGLREAADRTNPQRMNLRNAMYRVLEEACGAARLDWSTMERLDRGDGVVLLMPAGHNGVPLAGPFVKELDAALGEHERHYQNRHRIRLRVAVALGLCHRDDQGWLGDPLDEAVRLMDHAATRDRQESQRLVFVVSRGFHDTVVRQGYRQIDCDAYVPLPGAEPAWVLSTGAAHAN